MHQTAFNLEAHTDFKQNHELASQHIFKILMLEQSTMEALNKGHFETRICPLLGGIVRHGKRFTLLVWVLLFSEDLCQLKNWDRPHPLMHPPITTHEYG